MNSTSLDSHSKKWTSTKWLTRACAEAHLSTQNSTLEIRRFFNPERVRSSFASHAAQGGVPKRSIRYEWLGTMDGSLPASGDFGVPAILAPVETAPQILGAPL